MTLEQILGIVRHFITAIGTILVIRGVIDETSLEVMSGAIITLVSVIWSVKSKK